MASEEQKQELKLKIVVGLILLLVAAVIGGVGPGLPKILAKVQKDTKNPSTPERMYQIGTLMQLTFREKQALKVYEDYWRLYGDDHEDFDKDNDWGRVADESPNEDYASAGSYMPWLTENEERPKPIRAGKKEKEILGKVIMALAKYYKDERKYGKADHLYACLAFNWPSGSKPQKAGLDGIKFKKTRSF